jgi:hypothetical protein
VRPKCSHWLPRSTGLTLFSLSSVCSSRCLIQFLSCILPPHPFLALAYFVTSTSISLRIPLCWCCDCHSFSLLLLLPVGCLGDVGLTFMFTIVDTAASGTLHSSPSSHSRRPFLTLSHTIGAIEGEYMRTLRFHRLEFVFPLLRIGSKRILIEYRCIIRAPLSRLAARRHSSSNIRIKKSRDHGGGKKRRDCDATSTARSTKGDDTIMCEEKFRRVPSHRSSGHSIERRGDNRNEEVDV